MSKKETPDELLVVTTFFEETKTLPSTIETEDDAFKATDLLLSVRKKYNELEDRMTDRTKPASETIKLIKDDYNQFLKPLKEMEETLKLAIESYADKRAAHDVLRLEEARKETNDHTLTMPIGLKTLPGAQGDLRFRTKTKIDIVDQSVIPEKYLVTTVNMKLLEEDLENDALLSIPGVRVTQHSALSIYVK